ncbi:Gfo/Idh/MocA family protein [Kordiimonas gwangyangensis]|uniref:Gfo/Idh/MocA family protein n=1 Tax=Kordiimonas gwangyangensis TaxID=288022 RepID=UPI0009DAA523|nr:Gfo/Idh/MocA family oxidoreductase [Kordiimonas gwangyangensis]
MNISSLKILVLGCEHCHIRGNSDFLANRDDLEVVGVWGREAEYVRAMAKKLSAPVLSDTKNLPNADLAIITSDTRDHKALVAACAGKVPAVHIDKPLGLDSTDARELAQLAAPFGDLFAVGFFARLNPLMLNLKSLIEAGEIGALKHLSLSFGHTGRLDGWLDDWPMFGDRARFGYGSFGDIASQAIDVATMLAGRLKPRACVLRYKAGYDTDVGGTAIATASGGALVRIFASAEMTGPRFEIRADGELGSLWLRGRTLGKYDESGEPVTLMDGQWSQASDGPAALVARLQGAPYARYATASDGLYVNEMLDSFMALAT